MNDEPKLWGMVLFDPLDLPSPLTDTDLHEARRRQHFTPVAYLGFHKGGLRPTAPSASLLCLSRKTDLTREQRVLRILKFIGTEVAHVACDSDTSFNVKRPTWC